jgi:hypothetical protein
LFSVTLRWYAPDLIWPEQDRAGPAVLRGGVEVEQASFRIANFV